MGNYDSSMMWLSDQWRALDPDDLELAGIYADKPGYHNKRANLPSSDYSVKTPPDQRGDSYLAAAIDMTSRRAQNGDYAVINKYSNRLLVAGQNNDPRMGGWREFFGQTDSDSYVEGWDFYYHTNSTSYDLSHNWHIHLSELREFTTSMVNKQALLSVLSGESLDAYRARGGQFVSSQPSTPAGGTLHRAWPSYMKAGNYFGDINGPNQSHGGYYASEQADVAAIQTRLNQLGYNCGNIDGIFGPKTIAATTAWQKAKYASTTSYYGQVWSDDWAHLFTY